MCPISEWNSTTRPHNVVKTHRTGQVITMARNRTSSLSDTRGQPEFLDLERKPEFLKGIQFNNSTTPTSPLQQTRLEMSITMDTTELSARVKKKHLTIVLLTIAQILDSIPPQVLDSTPQVFNSTPHSTPQVLDPTPQVLDSTPQLLDPIPHPIQSAVVVFLCSYYIVVVVADLSRFVSFLCNLLLLAGDIETNPGPVSKYL